MFRSFRVRPLWERNSVDIRPSQRRSEHLLGTQGIRRPQLKRWLALAWLARILCCLILSIPLEGLSRRFAEF